MAPGGVDALDRPDPDGSEPDWAVTGLLYLRETGAARDLLHDTIEGRRRRSLLGQLPHLLFHLARSDADDRALVARRAAYSEAVELAREFGQLTELGASLAGLAAVRAGRVRAEECRALAAEATPVGLGRDVRMVAAWTGFALAELDLSFGDVGAAVTGFTALVDLLDDLGVGTPTSGPGPSSSRPCCSRRAGPSRRVDAAFRERAVRKVQPWSLARAARGRALLAGDDDLDECFGEALRLHAAGPDTFEQARTLMAYGARLRRARRRVDARVPLEEARPAFDALGARRWSDMVRGRAEADGLHARARTSGPVAGPHAPRAADRAAARGG